MHRLVDREKNVHHFTCGKGSNTNAVWPPGPEGPDLVIAPRPNAKTFAAMGILSRLELARQPLIRERRSVTQSVYCLLKGVPCRAMSNEPGTSIAHCQHG
jgi:hypothetical protein